MGNLRTFQTLFQYYICNPCSRRYRSPKGLPKCDLEQQVECFEQFLPALAVWIELQSATCNQNIGFDEAADILREELNGRREKIKES